MCLKYRPLCVVMDEEVKAKIAKDVLQTEKYFLILITGVSVLPQFHLPKVTASEKRAFFPAPSHATLACYNECIRKQSLEA